MNLFQEQISLEENAINLAVKQYSKAMGKANIKLPVEFAFLNKVFPLFIDGIDSYKQPGKGKKTSPSREIILSIPSTDLAYLCLNNVIRSCMNSVANTPLQKLSVQVGADLIDHLDYLKFKEHCKANELQDLKWAQINTKASTNWKRKLTIQKTAKKLGCNLSEVSQSDIVRTVPEEKYSELDSYHVGSTVLDILLTSTHMFTLDGGRSRKNNECLFLKPSQHTEEWLNDIHTLSSIARPKYLPCIIEPKPWQDLVDGGYYLKRGKSALKLLRIRKSDNFKQNVHNDLSKVFTCVNSIQNTPWTINKFILEVLQQEHLDNELDTIEVPEPLADTQYDFQRLMLQMPKTMRRNLQQRSVALGRITRIKSQIFAKKQSIDIAERMQKYPAIYFPHTLDYRGRVYPVPAYLHPQGDDVAKGLLMFADGKPLGEHGAKWLAIHGANSWGNNVDKLPFKQRLEWIRSNTHLILESASEPLKTAFWRDAEDPYQFLAFCKEWQGYQQQGKNFVSHLSINLDGSCNGLQHLSSLMKDSIGGSFVNLLPSESPHDVYTIVKEHTIETVEKDAREGNEIAKEWVGKVDRKIVKRPTMTQGYGVTLSGVKNQIKDEVKKIGKEYAKIQDNVFMYADYLAGIIYNSISEIMPGVTKAKEFLREIAKAATESNIPLKWTVPTGLCVLQEKLKQKQIKVDSFYGVAKLRGSTQKSCRITLNQDTDKLDKSEQMNAIVPNIIHSLDACHLMMVVNKCREVGIKDFAAIHDSFGTHACNVEELQKIIREEFVNLYKGNVLKDLFDQFQSQIPAKLPEPPEMGTLDIHQVMDSQYFFA